jgi:hypothetical protein
MNVLEIALSLKGDLVCHLQHPIGAAPGIGTDHYIVLFWLIIAKPSLRGVCIYLVSEDT